jgi:fructose-1,6-bisphosphatase
VAAIVLTLIVGFNWGGWVTGGSARAMAAQSGKDAVMERLVPICVYQFNQDLGKDQKLTELKDISTYQRRAYVEEHGWATMPGEEKADRQVASACAKLLVQINQ